MLGKIVNKIAENLRTYVNFCNGNNDKVVGLAKNLIENIASEKGMIKKTYPVYFNEHQEECNRDTYIDLVPNTKNRTIIYFVDAGSTLDKCDGRYFYFISTIRLIAWFNLKLINGNLYDTTQLQAVIFKNSIGVYDNFDEITKIHVSYLNPVEKNSNIFSAWTYDEAERQFLIYPYDYFAQNYQIKWAIGINCIEDITINPALCTT